MGATAIKNPSPDIRMKLHILLQQVVPLGRRIQEKDGKLVVRIFRKPNSSYTQVAEFLSARRNYKDIHFRVLHEAVEMAMRGYHGKDGYEGLLYPSELKKLASQHRSNAARRMQEEGRGLYGIPPQERIKHAQEAGRKGGNTTYQRSVGLFSMTPHQKQQALEKRIEAQGGIPWVPRQKINNRWRLGELDCAYMLSSLDDYLIQEGPGKGRVNNVLINKVINHVYHQGEQVRTPDQIRRALYKLRCKYTREA